MCIRDRSKEDIDKAVKEAERYADEDKKRREEVEQKNEAENLCYATEKLISDNADKISEDDKSAPVSYTHLDVYKRQHQILCKVSGLHVFSTILLEGLLLIAY